MAFPLNNGNHPHKQENTALNNQQTLYTQINSQPIQALNCLMPTDSQSQTNKGTATNNLNPHIRQSYSLKTAELQMYRQQLMQQRYLQNLNQNRAPNGNVALGGLANVANNNPIIPNNTSHDSAKKNQVTIDLTENNAQNKNEIPANNISRNLAPNVIANASQHNQHPFYGKKQAAIDLTAAGVSARFQNQALMHMSQFVPVKSLGPSYGISDIRVFRPQTALLADLFFQLSPTEAHTLLNLNFITARQVDNPNVSLTPHSRLISNAYCTYVSNKQKSSRGRNPKQIYALTCNGCYQGGIERPQWVHFPSSPQSLVPLIRLMSQHLATCPYINPRVRNQIIGRETDPRFTSKKTLFYYIPPFCAFNRLFAEPKKLQILYSKQSVYDDNMMCMEEARECATMNLRGVIASDICDLVDIDPIEDPPFLLFVCECLELVRIGRYSPEYSHFSQKLSKTNDESDLFALRCNCCHEEEKGNVLTFDPTALVLLQNTEQAVSDVSRLVFNRFQTFLKGHKLSVYNILKPVDPSGSNIVFQNFVTCLLNRIKALMTWLEEVGEVAEESNRKVNPRKDTELWVSLSNKQIREYLDKNNNIAVSSLNVPKEDNGLGSAVLECDVFAKYGLLHETIDFPTLTDMKSQSYRKKKRPRNTKKRANGAKVEDVDYLMDSRSTPKTSSLNSRKKRRVMEQDKPLVAKPMEQLPHSTVGVQDERTGTDTKKTIHENTPVEFIDV